MKSSSGLSDHKHDVTFPYFRRERESKISTYDPNLKTNPTVSEEEISIKRLREAIPEHCFHRSLVRSLAHMITDLIFIAITVALGLKIDQIPFLALRFLLWVSYGFVAGLLCTGIWIIAHECGHGAFSQYDKLNHVFGWTLHSCLLVPYFSWRSTHARHHRFNAHMEKDQAFVPQRREEFAANLGLQSIDLEELSEDAPIVALWNLLLHQTLGWPNYLFTHATAGSKSSYPREKPTFLGEDHFLPNSTVFHKRETLQIAISDIGLAIMLGTLYFLGGLVGWKTLFLLYGQPYLWVHHWLVAITYLHHTHPSKPHYEDQSWTFLKGSLSTVDRDFGFIGRHFFHRIVENHVIHHLFPKIPFYHADEATNAVKEILGPCYQKESGSFMMDLWATFRKCQWVEPNHLIDSDDGALYFNT